MKNLFTNPFSIRLTAFVQFALFFLFQNTWAQTPAPVCGSTEIFLNLMKDQNLKKRYKNAEKKLRQFSAKRNARTEATNDAVFKIPLVIHVFEPTSTPFISDAEIQEAVSNVNKAFRKQFPNSDGVDTEIQFQLAARTPDNKATNGIVRVNASHLPKYVTYGANGEDGEPVPNLMMLSNWSNMDYYNVWVVHQLNVNVAYAFYPTGGPTLYDGTVTSYYFFQNKTLTHELGHGMNLRHTFAYTFNGGDTDFVNCPPNADCTTDGDGICDTDPINQSANSNSDCSQNENKQNPCTGIGYGQVLRNYMGYQFDHCVSQFTNDQRTRMRDVILTLRPTLHDNESLLPPDPLPVTLVNFTAEVLENRAVLNWSTSAELQNDYFDVEHSVDARNFKAVGRLQAAGNAASSLSEYEFVHIPDNQSAIQYYRLKQTDTDGKYAYSKLIRVVFPVRSEITVGPNPVDDHLLIDGVTGKWKTEILSSSGQLLLQAQDQKRIDMKSLVPGLYVLKISCENSSVVTSKILRANR